MTNSAKNKLTAIIGLGFGDEGKGKLVQTLLKDNDITCRYNGASNCGHTVYVTTNGVQKKYVTRMMPTGVIDKSKTLVLGQGVYLDVTTFQKEVIDFVAFDPLSRLFVSDNAHLLLPYHKLADEAEEIITNSKIGTTKSGVGFCAQDKYARRGIRISDLKDEATLLDKLQYNYKYWQKIYSTTFGDHPEMYNMIFTKNNDKTIINPALMDFFKVLLKRSIDVSEYILSQKAAGKNILCEGAQSVNLDIDSKSYPYVTSSHCGDAGVAIGLGIAITDIDEVIGVLKPYETRVGNGPFETEITNEDQANDLRTRGNEFGSVTNRPRRVGWLNLDMLKTSIRKNGVTSLALTKVDVLFGMQEVFVKANNVMIPYNNFNNDCVGQLCKQIFNKTITHVDYISYGVDINQISKREQTNLNRQVYYSLTPANNNQTFNWK